MLAEQGPRGGSGQGSTEDRGLADAFVLVFSPEKGVWVISPRAGHPQSRGASGIPRRGRVVAHETRRVLTNGPGQGIEGVEEVEG